MGKKRLSFEQALKKLETIAERIERGEIGLEESIDRYDEGMTLVKECRAILAKAEYKIRQIHERADGTLEAEDTDRPQPE